MPFGQPPAFLADWFWWWEIAQFIGVGARGRHEHFCINSQHDLILSEVYQLTTDLLISSENATQ